MSSSRSSSNNSMNSGSLVLSSFGSSIGNSSSRLSSSRKSSSRKSSSRKSSSRKSSSRKSSSRKSSSRKSSKSISASSKARMEALSEEQAMRNFKKPSGDDEDVIYGHHHRHSHSKIKTPSNNGKKSSGKPPCPEGKERNPNTGRCVNKCAPGKVRNDKGRCVNAPKAKKSSSSRKKSSNGLLGLNKLFKQPATRKAKKSSSPKVGQKPCPEGKERNPNTGRCVNKCAPGKVRNDKGRCVNAPKAKSSSSRNRLVRQSPQEMQERNSGNKKPCPEGKERNPNTGRCINKCAPGKVRNDKGRCVNASKTQKKSSNNGLFGLNKLFKQPAPATRKAKKSSSPKVGQKPCPEGKERNPNTGRCVNKCAPGKIRNDKGRCVNAPKAKSSSSKRKSSESMSNQSSLKATDYYGYNVKEDVKDYLNKKVINASGEKIRKLAREGFDNEPLYINTNFDELDDDGMKEYIVYEILELAKNDARDMDNSDLITMTNIIRVINNDDELSYLLNGYTIRR